MKPLSEVFLFLFNLTPDIVKKPYKMGDFKRLRKRKTGKISKK